MLVFIAIFTGTPPKLDGLSNGLVRQPQAIIVFPVLIIAFRHHVITGQLRITPQLHVFFGNCLRCTAQFHVRSITVENTVAGTAATAAAQMAAATAAMPPIPVAIPVLVVVIVLALT